MSRVGIQEIKLPAGVSFAVSGDTVTVKGPKGQLTAPLMPGITVSDDKATIKVERADDEKQTRAYHGLCRSLINNAVIGVNEGYKKELEIHGVGYRATVKSPKQVELALGFSHVILFPIPAGITIEADKKGVTVVITGIDKQQVGQVAANIRKMRPPEPYKGKGIRYKDEYVIRKVGKSA
jgi:large subunit ribosomal protein L6